MFTSVETVVLQLKYTFVDYDYIFNQFSNKSNYTE